MHFHVATELDTRSEQTSSWSERFQECRRGGESSPEDALSEIQVQKVQVSTSPHIDHTSVFEKVYCADRTWEQRAGSTGSEWQPEAWTRSREARGA